jgi:hypothetical protein
MIRHFVCALSLVFTVNSVAADNTGNPAVIELDETVILGNQELPKVLYILPWQTPTGLPEIEVRADFTEVEVFRSLYPPAYRRELKYFETLEKISESNSDQEQ